MKPNLIGQRYRIRALIGEGGMASVYAALDEKLNRQVAIKVLHQHLARNSDIRQRFLLEARTVSTLDHPNILKVYDFSGLDSEQLWMVTEILHGVDLAEYVKRFPKHCLHPIVTALIVREICRALQEVHKLQVVHRDIKPENIMILDNGHLKLMDFGIAKVHRANATQTGTFMGSPSYMSPEQIRGADVDKRADVYSLCVLFYEIGTGMLPYSGQTTAEVINKIISGRYTLPHHLNPNLPVVLSDIIVKGMQNAKEQRYGDVNEMAADLDSYLAAHGFLESRIELQRFVLHRVDFEERLLHVQLAPTQVSPQSPIDRQPGASRPAAARARAPSDDPDQTHAPKLAPMGQDSKGPGAFGPTQHSASPNDQTEAPRLQKGPPRAKEKTRVEAAPHGPAPERRTVGPKPYEATAFPGKTKATPVRRIFIREYGTGEQRRSLPSSSTFILLGLIAAIALVVMIGGDRLTTRMKRDMTKIAQQLETNDRKKPSRDEGTSQPPSAQNGRAVDEAGPNETPLIVESQTVTIDSSPKSTPRLSKKEVSTPRSPKTLASNTRTLPASRRSATSKRPLIASVPDDVTPVSSGNEPPIVNDSIPNEAPPSRERGTLKIAAYPAAEILIDGKLYGTTNDRDISSQGLKLEPGSYALKLKRKGYKAQEHALQIRSGEIRQLNVALSKTIDLLEFTIRSNRLPARIEIEGMRDGGKKRKEITMNRNVQILKLLPGRYRVAVTYGQETKARDFELIEDDEPKTFNADFK